MCGLSLKEEVTKDFLWLFVGGKYRSVVPLMYRGFKHIKYIQFNHVTGHSDVQSHASSLVRKSLISGPLDKVLWAHDLQTHGLINTPDVASNIIQ